MNENRKGGIAIIAGAIAELVVMALHPQGQAVKTSELILFLNGIVHTVAIMAMPILFVGLLALTRALMKTSRLAILAIAFYGLALVAGMCAAAISGYITPNIIHRMSESVAADAQFWSSAGRLSWWMNQAFARILATNSGIAIMLWSIAMNRQTSFSRAISVYGIVTGALVATAVGSGHVRLDVHGFGAVTLLETIWLVATGIALMRIPD